MGQLHTSTKQYKAQMCRSALKFGWGMDFAMIEITWQIVTLMVGIVVIPQLIKPIVLTATAWIHQVQTMKVQTKYFKNINTYK
jgi:hypothetical protein